MGSEYRPQMGDLVADISREPARIGEYKGATGYRDKVPHRLWLRPVGGGYEWSVKLEKARPATAAEALSARVADENQRSLRAAR